MSFTEPHFTPIPDGRHRAKQNGITYYLTIQQICEARKNGQMQHLSDYFNSRPFKEKILIRPDWEPEPDDTFYPDPSYE